MQFEDLKDVYYVRLSNDINSQIPRLIEMTKKEIQEIMDKGLSFTDAQLSLLDRKIGEFNCKITEEYLNGKLSKRVK
jgi:hypothetical protein